MNNEIKHSVEFSTVEIIYLRTACSLAKELSIEVTDWDILRDKLNNYLDELYKLK